MIFDLNDTIVAISSAPGNALKGIIRLSGPDAINVFNNIWEFDEYEVSSRSDKDLSVRKYIAGKVILKDNLKIPANVIVFRSPYSYTTEDMVELYLPGSYKLLEMVLGSIKSFPGMRDAHPGEFTARAFLNGRIDLTEAEAVAEVIHASGDAQLRAAENLLKGVLHRKCCQISNDLAELLALLEAGIDFSDQEDISFIEIDVLNEKLNQVITNIKLLLAESVSWQDLNNLPKVVMVGPPNAGKSSLMNKLTNLDRSIVCSIAGTTRDILSAPINLALGECLLIDTPGIGQVDDVLAAESQIRVIDIIKSADLVLVVWDPGDMESVDEIITAINNISVSNVLLVANKSDLYHVDYIPDMSDATHECELFVSALTGKNLDILLAKLSETLHFSDSIQRSEAIALTNRQYSALTNTSEILSELSENIGNGLAEEEIIALNLREALDFIGSISGEIASDEVLGKIFSNFCIGK